MPLLLQHGRIKTEKFRSDLINEQDHHAAKVHEPEKVLEMALAAHHRAEKVPQPGKQPFYFPAFAE